MSKKITLIVVGLLAMPQTAAQLKSGADQEYYDIGAEIEVDAKKAAIYTAAGVCAPEGTPVPGAARPADRSAIAELKDQLKESQAEGKAAIAYQTKVEGILKAADITVDDLAELLKPKAK